MSELTIADVQEWIRKGYKDKDFILTTTEIQRLIAAEREACAKLAEEIYEKATYYVVQHDIAKAIRAMGDKPQ